MTADRVVVPDSVSGLPVKMSRESYEAFGICTWCGAATLVPGNHKCSTCEEAYS